MKRLNQVLIACLAAALIFCLVFHICGTLSAEVSGVAASANDHPDTYNNIIELLKSGSFVQSFSPEVPQSSDDIYMVATTIALHNKGFCTANWLEATVIGASGDIVVYSMTGANSDIAPGETGELILKLLTRTPNEIRKVKVRYYIMGVQRTITVTI